MPTRTDPRPPEGGGWRDDRCERLLENVRGLLDKEKAARTNALRYVDAVEKAQHEMRAAIDAWHQAENEARDAEENYRKQCGG